MSYTTDLQLGPRIAHGHFGDVHEGVDAVHGRVAVKVLRQLPGESDPEWVVRREELLSEAQHLKAAEHANIVRIHNLVRHASSQNLHLVMEFCTDGSTVSYYENGPARLNEVRRIATDLCLGLQAVHARGLVHRDIKPGNVLESGGRYKVGDFGLVTDKVMHGYASAAGYLDHLAFETHTRSVTSTKTDVWAVGMTLYRLLHGRIFYDHHFGSLDIETEIKNGGFALRLPWLPHVPDAWRRFIRKAMHDDSDSRIQSAFAVGPALSSLPTEPDWECDFEPTRSIWSRQKGARQVRVEMRELSPRKHEWNAESRGGGKRNLTLGKSDGAVSPRTALSQLEQFFASAV